jgi:hypothetical protein
VPVFKLTLWETSIARDEEIYLVIADTKERAAALLRKLHTRRARQGKRRSLARLPVSIIPTTNSTKSGS